MDATTRQAAHVMLDTVSAMHAAPAAQGAAMKLGVNRLGEVGAVKASMDDDGGVTVDVSEVMSAAAATIEWLVAYLAGAVGVSHDEVVVRVRRFIDHET